MTKTIGIGDHTAIACDPRQAIATHYIGPTNTRGSRVKAQCEAGSVTLEWDDSLNQTMNHAAACRALLTKLDWRGHWYMGGIRGRGYVFVQA
jgi:hypothetical protein